MTQSEFSSLIIQSSSYGRRVVEALKPFAEVKTILPRRRLYLSVGEKHYCIIILDGQVSIHRKEDDLLLASVNPPAIFGLNALAEQSLDIYFKTLTPATVGKLEVSQAEKLANELNLWEDIGKNAMVLMKKFFIHTQLVTSSSTLNVVCAQLQELICEDPKFRTSITAELYIRNKTALSRSRVMQVLSDLRKDGYIETERGILMKINHLPGKF